MALKKKNHGDWYVVTENRKVLKPRKEKKDKFMTINIRVMLLKKSMQGTINSNF